MAVGTMVGCPGAINFWSLATSVAKLRTRVRICNTVDLTVKFGVNKYYIPPPIFHQSLRAFQKSLLPAVDGPQAEGSAGPTHLHIDGEGVVSLNTLRHVLDDTTDNAVLVDQMLTVAPPMPQDSYDYRYEDAIITAVGDNDSPLDAVSSRGGLSEAAMDAVTAKTESVNVAARVSSAGVSPAGVSPAGVSSPGVSSPGVPRQSRRIRNDEYRKKIVWEAASVDVQLEAIAVEVAQHLKDLESSKICIHVGSMSWAQADKEHPDKAPEAHLKELRNIFFIHKVARPVWTTDGGPVHRSHDLFDIKLADDSGKSRFVMGKVIGGRDAEVEWGIDLAAPTMDMRLIMMMLSGTAIFFGECKAAVFSSSGKQKCVTRSTCDSEIVPFEGGTYLGAYFRGVAQEIGVDVRIVNHWEDNESALTLVDKGTRDFSRKRKHFISMINSAKEYFEDKSNLAVAHHCGTDLMTADIGTKCLYGSSFKRHRASMRGCD
jgi:hypothetical protein